MRDLFVTYDITLTATGPVFVGNGKEIGKKEYLLSNRKAVVLDMQKLYAYMRRTNRAGAFEDFMLEDGRSFQQWANYERIPFAEIERCARYSLESGDFAFDRRKKVQVMEFIKDAYGLPYIPGSSFKGMLRTILLGADLCERPSVYRSERMQLEKDLYLKRGRKILTGNIRNVEAIRYRTLNRDQKNTANAVNDILSGVIISDSDPIDRNALVLCQKIERHPDGQEKSLNLLRECIKPGTKIRFHMTIDRSLCDLTGEQLKKAIEVFNAQYYDNFSRAFSGIDRLKPDQVFLGGGSGFVSKTVVYPMFGHEKGVEITKEIFERTNVPKEHKHYKDVRMGVSPHILKCTRYRGQTMQMGLCSLEISPAPHR